MGCGSSKEGVRLPAVYEGGSPARQDAKPSVLNKRGYSLLFENKVGHVIFYTQGLGKLGGPVEWSAVGGKTAKSPNLAFGVTDKDLHLHMLVKDGRADPQQVLEVPLGVASRVDLSALGPEWGTCDVEPPEIGCVHHAEPVAAPWSEEAWLKLHVKGQRRDGRRFGIVALERSNLDLVKSWVEYLGNRVRLQRQFKGEGFVWDLTGSECVAVGPRVWLPGRDGKGKSPWREAVADPDTDSGAFVLQLWGEKASRGLAVWEAGEGAPPPWESRYEQVE